MTIHRLAAIRRSSATAAASMSARPQPLFAPDGARAESVDEGISFFDAGGRLLVRYENGALHVSPPKGDLVLASVTGAVRIAAASDVVVEARRDVVVDAPRKVELRAAKASGLTLDPKRATLEAPEVVVRAEATSIEGRSARIAVERLATTAKEIVTTAERWETTATQVALRARDMVHEVTGALTEQLGRFRGVVREAYVLRTGRTDLRSKADTSIDGKRVLLG